MASSEASDQSSTFNRVVILDHTADLQEHVRKLNSDGYRIVSVTVDRVPLTYVQPTETHQGVLRKPNVCTVLLAERMTDEQIELQKKENGR